jgi:hypothetical protein
MKVSYCGEGILVYGNTKPHRLDLKSIGGQWNRILVGWIFPKSKGPLISHKFNITIHNSDQQSNSDLVDEEVQIISPQRPVIHRASTSQSVVPRVRSSVRRSKENEDVLVPIPEFRKRLLGLYPGKMVPLTASDADYLGGWDVIRKIYDSVQRMMKEDPDRYENRSVEDILFSTFSVNYWDIKIVFGWGSDGIHIFELLGEPFKRGSKWLVKSRYLNASKYGQQKFEMQDLQYLQRSKKWRTLKGTIKIILDKVEGSYYDNLPGHSIESGTLFDQPIDTKFQVVNDFNDHVRGHKDLSIMLDYLVKDTHDKNGIVLFTVNLVPSTEKYLEFHEIPEYSRSMELSVYLKILSMVIIDEKYEFTIQLLPNLKSISIAHHGEGLVSTYVTNNVPFHTIVIVYDPIQHLVLYPEQIYIDDNIIPDMVNYIDQSKWYIPRASYTRKTWSNGKFVDRPLLRTLLTEHTFPL